jgi:hypothetical protein
VQCVETGKIIESVAIDGLPGRGGGLGLSRCRPKAQTYCNEPANVSHDTPFFVYERASVDAFDYAATDVQNRWIVEVKMLTTR